MIRRRGRGLTTRAAPAGAAPGDLFVLRELAEFPVEWAIVERDPRDPSLLRVVPADAHPATGSADVRVAAAASGGPLNLRCGHATWLPARALAAGLHSGRLDPRDLEEAARRLADLGLGTLGSLRGDELGRETDQDPEYQDWIAGVVAPAAEALAAAARAAPPAAPTVPAVPTAPAAPTAPTAPLAPTARMMQTPSAWPPPHRRRLPPRFWSLAAAAVLLLATLGLSWQTLVLRREVERLSGPLFNIPSGEVVLGDETRGPARPPIVLRAGRGASHFLLTVVLGADLAAGGTGRLEVQDPAGRPLWRSPPFALLPDAEVNLLLPRHLLPGRTFRLALYRRGDASPIQVRNLVLATGP